MKFNIEIQLFLFLLNKLKFKWNDQILKIFNRFIKTNSIKNLI